MKNLNLILYYCIVLVSGLIIVYFLQTTQINAVKNELSNVNEKFSKITNTSSWFRMKGEEASCNEVCQKQNAECVFGQIGAGKSESDDSKIISCSEDYSKADWLRPFILNCICRPR